MTTTMISNGEQPYTENINLVDFPWIPVIDKQGSVMSVGLRELFERTEELVDLATEPLETIALYRLLFCVAQRALDGPKNVAEWKTAPKRLTEKTVAYLEQWKNRFYLFGERPFLQIAKLTSAKKNSEDFNKTDKLDLGLAVGNSNTVFDQNAVTQGRKHNAQWLAVKLITFQNFSSSGKIGGIARVGDYSTETGSCSAAPCAESSMLLTILKGNTLSETICWNLLTPDNVKAFWGKPVWEYEDYCEKKNQDEIGKSYLGRLAPLARFVKLLPNGRDMIVARGIEYSTFTTSSKKKSQKTTPRKKTTGTYREPMATIKKIDDEKDKKKKRSNKEKNDIFKYVKTEPERSPWRDLHSLLAVDEIWLDQLKAKGAVALGNLKLINKSASLWVGGIKFHPMRSAKVIDTVHWQSQLDKNMCEKNFLIEYKRGVNKADLAEKYLRSAAYAYCRSLLKDSDKSPIITGMCAQSVRTFWSNLERYQIELREHANKRRLDLWEERLIEVLFLTYKQCCPRNTARQIQAFIEGKKRLGAFAKKCVHKETDPRKEKTYVKESRLGNKLKPEQKPKKVLPTLENVQQKTLFDFIE